MNPQPLKTSTLWFATSATVDSLTPSRSASSCETVTRVPWYVDRNFPSHAWKRSKRGSKGRGKHNTTIHQVPGQELDRKHRHRCKYIYSRAPLCVHLGPIEVPWISTPVTAVLPHYRTTENTNIFPSRAVARQSLSVDGEKHVLPPETRRSRPTFRVRDLPSRHASDKHVSNNGRNDK